MTYGTCTWNTTFTASVQLLIVGWSNGVLTGNMRVTAQRTEPQGSASDNRQTCLAGSASYDDTQPISGSPSAITWSASPLASSSFLSGAFTGAMSGNTGQLGGDTVSGTLTYTAFSPASGGASIGVTLSR